ncbi:MAG: hypothetical protein ORN28_06525 [Rhodoferax sp.]|nr:hypothetical protein [Rhodoferax sp.]
MTSSLTTGQQVVSPKAKNPAASGMQWQNARRNEGPSQATVASANRFSRVAEG